MDKFFCNPSYPILFASPSSFSETITSDSINSSSNSISSPRELYDFFFDDNYQKQLAKQKKE